MWSGHGHRHLVVGEDEPAKPAAANAVQKLFTSAARRPRLAGWLDASDNAQVPYLVAIRTRRFGAGGFSGRHTGSRSGRRNVRVDSHET